MWRLALAAVVMTPAKEDGKQPERLCEGVLAGNGKRQSLTLALRGIAGALAFAVSLSTFAAATIVIQNRVAAAALTMGILTASLVVGSSIIMTVEGGPKLFGLPLFGLLGFLIAFFNSLWIIFSIWRSGKH